MNQPTTCIDVLCVGQATYDLIFSVPAHPGTDEKVFADRFAGCGGGPAANAAITVARLGFKAAFAGYLGDDLFGSKHWQELLDDGVDTRFIVRGKAPTPLSAILVKPDGRRALINYKGATRPLNAGAVDYSNLEAKVMLFDGHEPNISLQLARYARYNGIPTVLDAGSVHEGSIGLLDLSDYLVASEKFALQYAGDIHTALRRLAETAPAAVITLGENGLIWQRGNEQGELPAYPVIAIDSTGAGDAFHGAFAAALAAGQDWLDILNYASAAGALCCTKTGARPGLPTCEEMQDLLR
ncbi:carbohydrate kinase family protein [Methylotuvimicrobium buryatense]|uniref:Carbohydrate kinase n=1 Tax=Methylotuvimicrobium buryatense TaxID=95641 RepID=A0A4P9UVE9_METBY|nr:PfkB family carbohydrate kinase [Methylotuvimicrobium buryatense]QCW84613.1 carbohydrate kinase [Methylotuvimicrobium buryatense]